MMTYLGIKPTAEECREQNWTECAAPYEPWGPYAVNEVIKWLPANVWPQDYVYQNGRIFFRHTKDAVLFMLRWA